MEWGKLGPCACSDHASKSLLSFPTWGAVIIPPHPTDAGALCGWSPHTPEDTPTVVCMDPQYSQPPRNASRLLQMLPLLAFSCVVLALALPSCWCVPPGSLSLCGPPACPSLATDALGQNSGSQSPSLHIQWHLMGC